MANKVYIAGKITGDPNYREKFAEAEKELKRRGYLVMNPAVLPEGFEWNEYMQITKAMLGVCDTIYLLHDWKESEGAIKERLWALTAGCTMIYQKAPKCPQKLPQKH